MFAETLLTNDESRFAVRDRCLAIATDDPFVERFVRDAYSRAILAPMDTSARLADRGTILTHGKAPLLVFNGEERPWPADLGRCRDSMRAAYYGSRELFRLSVSRLDSCWPIYGAAVAVDQQAVIILGPSGVGKTTLALALVAQGARFYGDECVFVDGCSLDVDGLARSLMIREPALDVLSSIGGLRHACNRSSFDVQPAGRLWYAVEPDEIFGRAVRAGPMKLGAVLVLDEPKRHDAAITRLPNSMASLFIARNGYIKAAALKDITAGSRALADVVCYRVQGMPEEAARLIVSALSKA